MKKNPIIIINKIIINKVIKIKKTYLQNVLTSSLVYVLTSSLLKNHLKDDISGIINIIIIN